MTLLSLPDYERFVYTLPQHYPSIHQSTLVVIRHGATFAELSGAITFDGDITLEVWEDLNFAKGVIQGYSYAVNQGGQRLYWYDPQPHPNDPSLAPTHPHHKHVPPDIKHNRIPAPGLSFNQANLPFLIGRRDWARAAGGGAIIVLRRAPARSYMKIRIVAISDTHDMHDSLTIPDGDVLLHAGDLTDAGTLEDLERVNDFFGSLPHAVKLVVAGNHDSCLEEAPQAARAVLTNCTYLQDEAFVWQGVKFYGSPWHPTFPNMAFNLDPGPAIRQKWDLIPPDTDVLITHGPPYGHRDRNLAGYEQGCHDLLAAVLRVRPALHIFGHIHEGRGIVRRQGITFANASSCDISYAPIHPPMTFDVDTNLNEIGHQ